MNTYNSETSRARSTKFKWNIFYYYAQVKCVSELGHALYRLCKSLKIELNASHLTFNIHIWGAQYLSQSNQIKSIVFWLNCRRVFNEEVV